MADIHKESEEHVHGSGVQRFTPHVCDRIPAVELMDVTVALGGHQVLKKVSMQVCRGTIHAIVGPNGGGKTMLLRTILGQIPYSGNVYLRLRPKGAVGYVPQFLDFDKDLPITVEDFLAISRRERPGGKGTRDRSMRALSEVNGEKLASKQLGALSGGEMRRVLLAQALEPMPDLLLLDEVAAGVDEAGRRLFNELLLHVCEEHKVTIMEITHDMAAVREYCHLVTCINQEILFEGNPKDTLTLENIIMLFSAGPAGVTT